MDHSRRNRSAHASARHLAVVAADPEAAAAFRAAVVEGPRRVKRPAPESSEQDAVCKAAEELRASPPPARALDLLRSLDAAAIDVGLRQGKTVIKWRDLFPPDPSGA